MLLHNNPVAILNEAPFAFAFRQTFFVLGKAPKATFYQVMGKRSQTLWQQRKLSHETYERYTFLCRDGVGARKRNLDIVRQWEETAEEDAEREATGRRNQRKTTSPEDQTNSKREDNTNRSPQGRWLRQMPRERFKNMPGDTVVNPQ